jgi:hypothetical protein
MTPPLSERVEEMKKRLVEADDFSDFFNHFFDCTESWLLDVDSRRIRDAHIEDAASVIVSKALGGNATADDFLLIEVKGTSLVHGSCSAGGFMGTIVYFRDLEWGAMAISRGMGGLMTFCRFKPWQDAPIRTPVQ